MNVTRLKETNLLKVSLGVAAVILAACLLAVVARVEPVEGATLPLGFEDRVVATGAPKPIDMAFTPDARMLIASQAGQLRVRKNGQLLQAPALDLSKATRICNTGEHGLSGVTVDPNFSANHFLWIPLNHNCLAGEQHGDGRRLGHPRWHREPHWLAAQRHPDRFRWQQLPLR